MVAVILFGIFYLFVVVFQCSPVTFFWAQYEGVKGRFVNPHLIASSNYAHSAPIASAGCKWIKKKAFFVCYATGLPELEVLL
jgi:hypothetical protein